MSGFAGVNHLLPKKQLDALAADKRFAVMSPPREDSATETECPLAINKGVIAPQISENIVVSHSI